MPTSKKSKVVVGVFTDRGDASRAVEELRQAKFRADQIGIITRDQSRKGRRKKGEETLAEEGTMTGALAGAGIGALLGWGILAGAIPAIGPAVAGGTLAVLLANAAGGAVVAGLVGMLIGYGIPEEEAQWYESELKAGRTIVTVKATSRAEEARAIIRRNNGYDKSTAPGTPEAAGTEAAAPREKAAGGHADTEGGQTLELREEELEAHTVPVKKGEVKVRKEVVTEPRAVDVPVTREEVVVERRPAGGRPASSSDLEAGEEVRIPVREEQVDVSKTPVVREEVHVGKRAVTDTETVSGTVRKEKVRVKSEGDVPVSETSSRTRARSRKK